MKSCFPSLGKGKQLLEDRAVDRFRDTTKTKTSTKTKAYLQHFKHFIPENIDLLGFRKITGIALFPSVTKIL